jgi:hypothetical protein
VIFAVHGSRATHAVVIGQLKTKVPPSAVAGTSSAADVEVSYEHTFPMWFGRSR